MQYQRWLAGPLVVCLVLLCRCLPALAQASPLTEDPWSLERVGALGAPGHEGIRPTSRHYLWSNEQRHDLFFDDVHGLRGGYIGVGADQNYTLAAAAGAEAVWLIDLDVAVINLHRLYLSLIADSSTAEEFLLLMDGRHTGAVAAAVQAHCPDPAEQRAALSIYDQYRDVLYQRLRRTYRQRAAERPTTWLGDPELYQIVQRLVVSGRMVARLGDLNGPRTLRQIGDAARAAGVAVRVLYLSNAESWFPYGPRFARNLSALPFDNRSVVLRTLKSAVLRYPPGDFWHFSVQGAPDFLEKLSLSHYGSIDEIMADVLLDRDDRDVPMPEVRGLSHIVPALTTDPRNRPLRDLQQGLVTRPSASPDIPPGSLRLNPMGSAPPEATARTGLQPSPGLTGGVNHAL